MKHLALAGLFLALTASTMLVAERSAAPAPATVSVKLNGQTFTLPAGFEIELVAGPPLVNRPITADFDDQGRLYVTDANGAVTREDVAKKKPMHRVLRLESLVRGGERALWWVLL